MKVLPRALFLLLALAIAAVAGCGGEGVTVPVPTLASVSQSQPAAEAVTPTPAVSPSGPMVPTPTAEASSPTAIPTEVAAVPGASPTPTERLTVPAELTTSTPVSTSTPTGQLTVPPELPSSTPVSTATPAPADPIRGVQTGRLEVRVTDAPPDDVSNIIVTVSDIRVHISGSAGGTNWLPVIDEQRTFDLVEITGVEQVLGTAELEAGRYTQIRMNVVSVEVTFKPRGEAGFVTRFATVASGELKVVRPFEIAAGETTVLTLDFDAAKAVVVTGKGDVRFKPVVRLLVRSGAGIDSLGQADVRPAGVAQEDITPPQIAIAGVSDGEASTGPVTIEFSVSDDVDLDTDLTITATLNGDPFTSGTVISEVGSYTLRITAADSNGNETELEQVFEIVVETETSTQGSNIPPHLSLLIVTIDGDPAPDGTVITAIMNGQAVATAITADGQVVLLIEGDASSAGQTISFRIGDLDAAETDTWEQGGHVNVAFNISSSRP